MMMGNGSILFTTRLEDTAARELVYHDGRQVVKNNHGWRGSSSRKLSERAWHFLYFDRFCSMKIDELEFFNYALSYSEIKRLRQAAG